MKTFRCTICGEVYVGENKPSDCPFCGAGSKYIKDIREVEGKEIFAVDKLSDESRRNLITALNLEISNASFYKCASENSASEYMRALFKRLAKIEKEHADIIRKFLDLEAIKWQEEECSTLDIENLRNAEQREDDAVKFYKKAMSEAKEAKISSFFKILAEVEEGHLEILKKI